MSNFFECRVKYTAIDSVTGKNRKISEPYLIDALSYTEAEKKIHEEMEAVISGEFLVTNIRPAKYSDIIVAGDGNNWFKSRVALVMVDDKGKESRVNQNMLVLADDTDKVSEKINLLLANVTIPYEITSIAKSKIVDVFLYKTEDEKKIEEEENV